MTLFLVQHGEAKPETEDLERSLTDRGTETVGRMADWAARMGISVDEFRHIGRRRDEQTAMIFAKKLDTARGVTAVKGLNPEDDVNLVAASLQGNQESIMLVGHLSYLSRLVSLLMTDNPEIEIIRFRNAEVVCLEQREAKWAIDRVLQPELLLELDHCDQRSARARANVYSETRSITNDRAFPLSGQSDPVIIHLWIRT